MSVRSIWRQIRNKLKCEGCPLEHEKYKPLVIKMPFPDKAKVIVITESPNRRTDEEFLTSMANHPTYTFLYTLFGGKFRPTGPSANTYWTHLRKCFIDGEIEKGRSAIRPCSRSYLESELVAFKPKLVLGVGNEALDFLSEYDKRLQGSLTKAFSKQVKEVFKEVKIGEMKTDIAIVPHPSGLNRFGNNPPKKTLKVLRRIRKTIIKTVEPKVTKTQYKRYVLEKIREDRIYCKECRVKWPKTRVKPSQAYSIYLRDPEGHVLYVFCLDCKMSHKRDQIRVHEGGGRKTMFCPKGHKIKLKLTMKELKSLIS